MTYNQLITKINNYYQKVGLNQWPAAPVIHEGFPGNFNLSLSEYEFLNQNADFFNLQKDMVYVKNQPCIRHGDFGHIQRLDEDSYRYLLRFTMAPVSGISWKKDVSQREKETKRAIFSLLDFLTYECGLDKNKLYVQYLKSDKISVLTEGKYNFDYFIHDDPNMKYYKEYGITNFMPVSDRKGLLALNVYGRPTPWGYRNEIFYEYNGKLLDIATIESLTFKPVFNDKKMIVGLEPYPYTLVVGAIGVERVLMIINNLDDINAINLIAEPAEILRPYIDPDSAKQLIQTLRTIQLILADGGKYQSLDKRRKEKMRDFFQVTDEIITKNQIPIEIMVKVLKKIAELEPDLPQLNNAISLTVQEYELYKLRNQYIHSWQEHLDELPKYSFY